MQHSLATIKTIAQINDHFRQKWNDPLGKIVFSSQVAALSPQERVQISRSVRLFSDFSQDNDPYDEHNFGTVSCRGEKYFWKFDYFDENYKFASDDPSNLAKTRRVLTIMHSQEY